MDFIGEKEKKINFLQFRSRLYFILMEIKGVEIWGL